MATNPFMTEDDDEFRDIDPFRGLVYDEDGKFWKEKEKE
jgi:hypothetical protein